MFDWQGYLTLAEQLAAGGFHEAALRTAISRAYYAVYHRASSHLREHALVPASERLTHQKVWATLGTDGDPVRLRIGVRGNELKRLRVEADYRAVFPEDLTKAARDAVLEARSIIDLIERL